MLKYYENTNKILEFMNSIGLYSALPDSPAIIKNVKESEYRIFFNKKREVSSSFSIQPPDKNVLSVSFWKGAHFENTDEFDSNIESVLFQENDQYYSLNALVRAEILEYFQNVLAKFKPEIDETFKNKTVKIMLTSQINLNVLGNGRNFDFNETKRFAGYEIDTKITVIALPRENMVEEMINNTQPVSLNQLRQVREDFPMKSYEDKSGLYLTRLFNN